MAAIEETVSLSYFSRTSFSVSYPDSGETLCAITFLPLPDKICVLGEARLDGDQLHPYACSIPGEYKTKDEHWLKNIEEFQSRVSQWTNRIREDLTPPTTVEGGIHEFREPVESQIKNRGADAAGYFTEQEAAELTSNMEEMANKLQELKERAEITERELKYLKDVLAGAKKDLRNYPKGVWYRETARRLWEVIKRVIGSTESREILVAEARKLLGLGP